MTSDEIQRAIKTIRILNRYIFDKKIQENPEIHNILTCAGVFLASALIDVVNLDISYDTAEEIGIDGIADLLDKKIEGKTSTIH